MYIGVDVGRGYTKVVSKNDVFQLPCYVAEARKLDLEAERSNIEHLTTVIKGFKRKKQITETLCRCF